MELSSTTTFTTMTTTSANKTIIGLYKPPLNTYALSPPGSVLTKVSNKLARRVMLTKALKLRSQPHHGTGGVLKETGDMT